MTETAYAQLVINLGYGLLAARGVLLFVLIRRLFPISSQQALYWLFWNSLGMFLIAVFELVFIYVINHYPSTWPFLARLEIDDTFFISPFYFLNDFLFLNLFFSKIIDKKNGNWVQYVGFILVVFEIVNTLYFEGYKDAQSIGSFLIALNGIILSLLFFRQYFLSKFKMPLLRNGLVFIVGGIFFQYIFSILFYFFSDLLYNENIILYYQISTVRMVMDISALLLMAYGVAKVKI